MSGSRSSARPGSPVSNGTTDVTSVDDLLRLAEIESRCCVSMYVPTHRAGRAVTEDRIRLKNQLARAARELTSLECAERPEDLLAPAHSLLDDSAFWTHGEGGLAVLIEPQGTDMIRTVEPVEELMVVADRFHLKPLVRQSSDSFAFHILALSLNHVRLLRATRTTAEEVAVADLPRGSADTLRWDDREPQLRSHGAGRVGTGRVTAAYHGHGGSKDAHTADVDRFLLAVDRAIVGHLGTSAEPLVLAAVSELAAGYRRLSRHHHIVDDPVTGNPDGLTVGALHERAWPLVEPLSDGIDRADRERFLSGASQTFDSVTDAVTAAALGRVEAIFVPADVEYWGRCDLTDGSAIGHSARRPGDRDLADIAAIETLRHGGRSFVVASEDVPGGGEVAATLRF